MNTMNAMNTKNNGGASKPAGTNRPVHVERFGAIKVAVWLNQTSVGPIHNVTVTRTYKDGEEWRESGSFGFDDLLTLAKGLDRAHSWIAEQRQRRDEPVPA